MIKAKDLIRKEVLYKHIHSWQQPTNLHSACVDTARDIVTKYKKSSNKELINKLAKRLEREFLRNEREN